MEFDFHHDRGRGLLLQPLRLKMGMLLLCVTKKIARFYATLTRYVATLRDPKKCILRPLRLKMGMLRLCATENRYDATLGDPKQI